MSAAHARNSSRGKVWGVREGCLPREAVLFIFKQCLCEELVKRLRLYSLTSFVQGSCMTLVFPDGLAILLGVFFYVDIHRRGFVSPTVWF